MRYYSEAQEARLVPELEALLDNNRTQSFRPRFDEGREEQFLGSIRTFWDQLTGCRIEDRTRLTPKTKRIRQRDPSKVYALVLHQMAFSRGSDSTRYDNVTAHFAILPDGKILQLHPVSAYLYASNGFNKRSVAVEFAGNFPSTRGRCWKAKKFGCHQLTQQQIQSGRCLVRHLINTIGLTHILAHRQASGTRGNCPGPDVWYNVGQWAINNLGLKDGGPGFKIGAGKPIPYDWRNSRVQQEFDSSPSEIRLAPDLEALLNDAIESDDATLQSEFPALITRMLSGSVGIRGTNRRQDVRSVQQLLNLFIITGKLPGFSVLTVDGIVGPTTIAAIKSFQQIYVGMKRPDGRVDPGGKTLEKLNGSILQSPASTANSASAGEACTVIGHTVRCGNCSAKEHRLLKSQPLPPPPRLVRLPSELCYQGRPLRLDEAAANAYQSLVRTARADGIPAPFLQARSAYRTYDHQAGIWSDRLVSNFRKSGCSPAQINCIESAIDRTNNALRAVPMPHRNNAWLNRFLQELQGKSCEYVCDPKGQVKALRQGTAPPGRSAHNFGRAIDIHVGGKLSRNAKNVARQRRQAAFRWLVCNASRFGFYPYNIEPWHWEYNPR